MAKSNDDAWVGEGKGRGGGGGGWKEGRGGEGGGRRKEGGTTSCLYLKICSVRRCFLQHVRHNHAEGDTAAAGCGRSLGSVGPRASRGVCVCVCACLCRENIVNDNGLLSQGELVPLPYPYVHAGRGRGRVSGGWGGKYSGWSIIGYGREVKGGGDEEKAESRLVRDGSKQKRGVAVASGRSADEAETGVGGWGGGALTT